MSRNLFVIALGLAVAVLALVALACEDDEPTAQEAEAQLCADLAELDAAIQALEVIGLDNSLDELKTASQAVSDAEDRVRESAQGVAEARVADVDTALNDLNSSVTEVPGDATIADAIGSIGDSLAGVRLTFGQLFDSIGCP